MATLASIANLALSRLGTRATIASLDEASVEARVCKANYSDCRDTLLRDFDWNFARRIVTLAPRDENPPSGWSNVYSLPNRCLRFRGLADGQADWALGSIEDVSGNDVVAIFANTGEATGICTMAIDNPGLFSAGFVSALSWRLAEAIALPITSKESIADRLARLAPVKVAIAMASEANEGITTTNRHVPDFLSARGYTE